MHLFGCRTLWAKHTLLAHSRTLAHDACTYTYIQRTGEGSTERTRETETETETKRNVTKRCKKTFSAWLRCCYCCCCCSDRLTELKAERWLRRLRLQRRRRRLRLRRLRRRRQLSDNEQREARYEQPTSADFDLILITVKRACLPTACAAAAAVSVSVAVDVEKSTQRARLCMNDNFNSALCGRTFSPQRCHSHCTCVWSLCWLSSL